MRNAFKMFLVSILLLSAIGAVAQIAVTNGQAGSAQENATATTATVSAAGLNEPAELFMIRLQSNGLLDQMFMRATANVAPTHAASTAFGLCNPRCTSGLICCICTPTPTCAVRAACNLFCR